MMKTILVLLGLILGVSCIEQVHASQNKFSWTDYNRFVEVAVGRTQQNYAEFDTSGLTADGILNTEKGNNKSTQLSLRWQLDNGIWLQAQTQRQNGTTNYQGYLQNAGGQLSPLSTRTSNVATHTSLQFGYAFNADTNSSMYRNLQITPFIQLAQNRWQRDLLQYQENYNYRTQAVGVLLQWQATENSVISIQTLLGRANAAKVSVSDFQFNALQAPGDFKEIQLSVSRKITILDDINYLGVWRASAHINFREINHGASPIINGLQAPPNQHRPITVMLGMQKSI